MSVISSSTELKWARCRSPRSYNSLWVDYY